MTIETKYNIGDEVWFTSGSKEVKGYIEYLRINYECGRWEEGKVETYTVRGYNDILYVVEAEHLSPTEESCHDDDGWTNEKWHEHQKNIAKLARELRETLEQ